MKNCPLDNIAGTLGLPSLRTCGRPGSPTSISRRESSLKGKTQTHATTTSLAGLGAIRIGARTQQGTPSSPA